jgi:hypothetical protein
MLENSEKRCALESKIMKRIAAIEAEMSSILQSINSEMPHTFKKKKHVLEFSDPSIQFIRAPLDVPTVHDAKSFFRGIGYSAFGTHVGPVSGWRTVTEICH